AENYRFRFGNRVPPEGGLGAGAAAAALGLVGGAGISGRSAGAGELLALGEPIEGHADNLAAALFGGVCLAARRNGGTRATKIARDMPVAAILAVPSMRTNTLRSRNGLPDTVSHEDAA